MTPLAIKQLWFPRFLSRLLLNFNDLDITMGEGWRSPETCELYAKEGKGIQNSCHILRIAQDLNILNEGKLSFNKADYAPLGVLWKKLPMFCVTDIPMVTCWGGDFKRPDIFHFSIEHDGVK